MIIVDPAITFIFATSIVGYNARRSAIRGWSLHNIVMTLELNMALRLTVVSYFLAKCMDGYNKMDLAYKSRNNEYTLYNHTHCLF